VVGVHLEYVVQGFCCRLGVFPRRLYKGYVGICTGGIPVQKMIDSTTAVTITAPIVAIIVRRPKFVSLNVLEADEVL